MADDIAALLKNFAEDIKTDLSKQIRANADISIKNHQETQRELHGVKTAVVKVEGDLGELKNTVHVLWRKVNGPNVPPPKSSGEYRQVDASMAHKKPLVEQVSQHDMDVEGLKAQVKVLDTKIDGVDMKVEGLDTKVDGVQMKVERTIESSDEARTIAKQTSSDVQRVLHLNEKQNESLGIGVSIRKMGDFFSWLKTKEGQKFAATMVAAIGSLATAAGTSYALVTKRLPMPTDPVPTVQTVYVPVQVTLPPPDGGVHAPAPSASR